jgi:predicted metal-dependent hydrolase
MPPQSPHPIVPREKLDFGLDGDIPKYWYGGDPFKTRFSDALSTIFPEGERYFITSVRAFRDEVTDPKLQAEIRDFIRQEGQHGVVHGQYNDMLRRQGINVDAIERIGRNFAQHATKHRSRAFNIAVTAAAEHLTALMAQSFFERKAAFAGADPRMRAVFAWHAMEEVEHKAVAFDVMQQHAKVGYFMRVSVLFLETLLTIGQTFYVLNYMLRRDGFSFGQRARIWAKGLWWLYGPGGLFGPTLRPFLAYFKPGFHPWKHHAGNAYNNWLDVFNRTGNPVEASEAVQAAAR